MKTPQQWLDDMKARPCVTEIDLLTIIKQIQDDALTEAKIDRLAESLDQALNEGKGVYKP